MLITIIIPAYNEEESIKLLYGDIIKNLDQKYNFEIIMIDDGSTDRSLSVMEDIAHKDARCRIMSFSKNYGQTAAIEAGFENAKGEVIVPMDADLQNDPASIPALLNKLSEGYDVVSGWRKDRKDKIFSRKITSWLANFFISRVTKIPLHDYGCSLKAYRSEVVKDIRLYGEMHRYIPAYIAWHGGRVAEIIVNHRPRLYGKTKYGIKRTLKVILDLLTVKFFIDYSTKPMHFFGAAGLICLFLAFLSGTVAAILKVFGIANFVRTPLPILTAFFLIVGVQFILMGLLAEILVRIYYESGNRKTYKIKKKINL